MATTLQTLIAADADAVIKNLGLFFEELCKLIYLQRQGRGGNSQTAQAIVAAAMSDAPTTGVVEYLRDYMEKVHIQWREIETAFGIVNGETDTHPRQIRFLLFLLQFITLWKEYDARAVPFLEKLVTVVTMAAAGREEAVLAVVYLGKTTRPEYIHDTMSVFVLALLEFGLLRAETERLPAHVMLALLRFLDETKYASLTMEKLLSLRNDTVYICRQYSFRLVLDLVGVSTTALCARIAPAPHGGRRNTRKQRYAAGGR